MRPLALALLTACSAYAGTTDGTARPLKPGEAEAVFAAGCFWCVESAFDDMPGVIEAVSGYTGGATPKPTYYQVGAGKTGHTEAVRVVYDPKKVSYEQLLQVFWHNVDPFDPDGQFCDQGDQYRPGVFPVDAAQAAAAAASKAAADKRLGKPTVVQIAQAGPFWMAEDYHQDYHRTNTLKYRYYRWGCGRDARLTEVWGADAGH